MYTRDTFIRGATFVKVRVQLRCLVRETEVTTVLLSSNGNSDEIANAEKRGGPTRSKLRFIALEIIDIYHYYYYYHYYYHYRYY